MTVPDTSGCSANPLTPWCFPEAWIVAIPVALAWALSFGLLLEHMFNLRAQSSFEFRFQALWTRLVSFIPIIALLAMLSSFWPWGTSAVDLVTAVIEAYIIACFLAIILGFGWAAGVDVPETLLQGRYTSTPWCGCSPFTSAKNCFVFWKWNVLQFTVVKPICMAILFLSTIRNKHTPPPGLTIVVRLIAALSIIRAIVSLLGMYSALRNHEKDPMGEHRVFWKLVIIKFLFGFIVLNFLIINGLITFENIPVDTWLCSYSVQNSNVTFTTPFNTNPAPAITFCQIRLINVAFVFEIALVALPAVLLFRHFAFPESQSAPRASKLKFLGAVLYPFDLHEFWSGSFFNGNLNKALVGAEAP